MTGASSFDVHAAGGVVWRRAAEPSGGEASGRGGGLEVAIVHRPRYDDWSLPKGKLDPGESFEDAARREIEEEVGVRAELGEELPSATYLDNKGRRKLVRYWLMEARDDPGFTPDDEVDELRWLPPGEARDLLSYERDRELLDHAKDLL
jgi:8-oxo-dGTP diphosphatase